MGRCVELVEFVERVNGDFHAFLNREPQVSGVFELPLKSSFSGGIPASMDEVSSPDEKTSAPAPSSASARITARLPFALAAKSTWTLESRLVRAFW